MVFCQTCQKEIKHMRQHEKTLVHRTNTGEIKIYHLKSIFYSDVVRVVDAGDIPRFIMKHKKKFNPYDDLNIRIGYRLLN